MDYTNSYRKWPQIRADFSSQVECDHVSDHWMRRIFVFGGARECDYPRTTTPASQSTARLGVALLYLVLRAVLLVLYPNPYTYQVQ